MRAGIVRRERLLLVLALVLLAIVGVFYSVLLAGAHARGGDLNDLVAAGQAALRRGWLSVYYRTGWEVIRTLPPTLWLYLPLGRVTPGQAFLIWTALMLACAVGAWWLAAPGRGLVRILWLAALITSFPFVYDVGTGQVVPVALVLLAATERLRRRRPAWAGSALAVALQLKPTLAFLAIPALAAAHEFRAAIAALAVSVAFLAVYLLLMGPGFPSAYLHATGGFLVQQEGYAIPNSLGPVLTYGLRAAAAVLALGACWRGRAGRLALGIGVSASLLASPYVHPHDLLVLFIAGWALHREAGGWAAAAAFVPGIIIWTLVPEVSGLVVPWEGYLLLFLCAAGLRLGSTVPRGLAVHASTAATVD